MASATLLLTILLVAAATAAAASKHCATPRAEYASTFLSPAITVRPGDVKIKFFDVAAPAEGRFATVNFHAELVFEDGTPVLQSDVYLHHYSILEYAIPAGSSKLIGDQILHQVQTSPPHVYHRKPWDGVGLELKQAWAMGGEARHLNFEMPTPYGLEGSAANQWVLNVHTVDMRGALHKLSCYECRCDVFNGGIHKNLPEGYLGGMMCCKDGARCAVQDYSASLERTIHLKYTWTYVPFDECVVPLQHVGLDVLGDDSTTVEYTVEGHCEAADFLKPECVDVREAEIVAEHGGDVVYVVSHLHTYSLGSTVWGEDGRLLCDSSPIYGSEADTAGNEDGYVVGVHHCNPYLNKNGLGKIRKGEKLRFQVKYSKVNGPHTGVMGVGFMKVAETGIASPGFAAAAGNRKILN